MIGKTRIDVLSHIQDYEDNVLELKEKDKQVLKNWYKNMLEMTKQEREEEEDRLNNLSDTDSELGWTPSINIDTSMFFRISQFSVPKVFKKFVEHKSIDIRKEQRCFQGGEIEIYIYYKYKRFKLDIMFKRYRYTDKYIHSKEVNKYHISTDLITDNEVELTKFKYWRCDGKLDLRIIEYDRKNGGFYVLGKTEREELTKYCRQVQQKIRSIIGI